MHIASLGSSFAAGPSIPPEVSAPARRSGSNYPSLLARALGAQLTDLTASGATLLNILHEPQQTLLATLPPQLEGLPADADVVTITAGGNDMGYSAGMLMEAAKLVIRDEGFLGMMMEGMGLKKDGVPGDAVGWEEVRERFVGVIDAIKTKAPKARIFLVEYLSVFGDETKVAGDQPLGVERVGVYRGMAGELGRAYGEAGELRGVEVVGMAGLSEGHALGSEEPWVEGFTKEMLMGGGTPFHPNAQGHRAVAEELVRRVRGKIDEVVG